VGMKIGLTHGIALSILEDIHGRVAPKGHVIDTIKEIEMSSTMHDIIKYSNETGIVNWSDKYKEVFGIPIKIYDSPEIAYKIIYE